MSVSRPITKSVHTDVFDSKEIEEIESLISPSKESKKVETISIKDTVKDSKKETTENASENTKNTEKDSIEKNKTPVNQEEPVKEETPEVDISKLTEEELVDFYSKPKDNFYYNTYYDGIDYILYDLYWYQEYDPQIHLFSFENPKNVWYGTEKFFKEQKSLHPPVTDLYIKVTPCTVKRNILRKAIEFLKEQNIIDFPKDLENFKNIPQDDKNFAILLYELTKLNLNQLEILFQVLNRTLLVDGSTLKPKKDFFKSSTIDTEPDPEPIYLARIEADNKGLSREELLKKYNFEKRDYNAMDSVHDIEPEKRGPRLKNPIYYYNISKDQDWVLKANLKPHTNDPKLYVYLRQHVFQGQPDVPNIRSLDLGSAYVDRFFRRTAHESAFNKENSKDDRELVGFYKRIYCPISRKEVEDGFLSYLRLNRPLTARSIPDKETVEDFKQLGFTNDDIRDYFLDQ